MGRYDHEEPRKKKRQLNRDKRYPNVQPVSANDIDPASLLRLIACLLHTGAAIRIGSTRDKSTWAIGIYTESYEPTTEYVKPGEDINEYLSKLGDWLLEDPPEQNVGER